MEAYIMYNTEEPTKNAKVVRFEAIDSHRQRPSNLKAQPRAENGVATSYKMESKDKRVRFAVIDSHSQRPRNAKAKPPTEEEVATSSCESTNANSFWYRDEDMTALSESPEIQDAELEPAANIPLRDGAPALLRTRMQIERARVIARLARVGPPWSQKYVGIFLLLVILAWIIYIIYIHKPSVSAVGDTPQNNSITSENSTTVVPTNNTTE